MNMQLNEQEASLVESFRRLSPETAEELSALAERLASMLVGQNVNWSDSWTDDDLRDFTVASLSRVEEREAE